MIFNKKKIIISMLSLLVGSFSCFSVANAKIITMTQQQYQQYQQQKQQEEALYQKMTEYYQAGITAYKNKNYQQALQYFEPIQSKFDKNKDYNTMVGDSFRNLNNFNNAITYLTKAYQLGATNYTTLTSLGYSYMDTNNYQKAYGYLKKATEMYPKQPDPYWNLGMTCLKLKNNSCALNAFNALVNVKPNYAPDPYVYIGDIYKSYNKATETFNAYATGVKYFKTNPLLNFLTGDILYVNTKYENAIPYFLTAVDYQPDYLDAYYELGGSYLQLDDLDRATTVCSVMQKVNSKDEKTKDLCNAIEQKRMQKMIEQQMMQDQIQRDIDQQNQDIMDMQAQQMASMGM